MSTKYQELTLHLAQRSDHRWVATFEEIEEILRLPLPDSARRYQAWWANQNRSQSLAWQSAGWRTAALDLKNEQVTFVYDSGDPDDPPDERASVAANSRPLTIAEAKAGLAARFGVDPSQIEIVIKG